jgi:hypothetical protein
MATPTSDAVIDPNAVASAAQPLVTQLGVQDVKTIQKTVGDFVAEVTTTVCEIGKISGTSQKALKKLEDRVQEFSEKMETRMNALEAQYVPHSHHPAQDIGLTNMRQGVQ